MASVKGTDFWLLTDPVTGDQVIGIEGIVGLMNSETGQEVDVNEGMSEESSGEFYGDEGIDLDVQN